MWRVPLLLVVITTLSSFTEAPVAQGRENGLEDCDRRLERPDDFARDECIGRNMDRQEARLERAFVAARSFIATRDTSGMMDDERRSAAYLERSQAAWRQFVDHDCTVRAGLTGGGNIWVSRYWAVCYSAEMDRRIDFLETVASGNFVLP
jgi:uncharacterized protein YecT (DUF1311 family)